jgi:CMP-N,N'-diacetyllegionaminic acid synthase
VKAEKKPEVLALILARGGSKSVPRKNLLKLAGKPLLAYPIEQALASKHITRTIVSTDDQEISAVACEFGAEVPFVRPAEFAGDLSPDIDAFRHALNWLGDNEGYECELVVHLRATGPVRRVELIDRAIESMFAHPEMDSLRSVSSPVQTPYKMWQVVNGMLKPIIEMNGVTESYSLPRQLLPEAYWQNGYVDIVRPHVVLGMNMMCGNKILPFIVEEPLLEIDYPEDIPRVEAALREHQEENEGKRATETKRHSV